MGAIWTAIVGFFVAVGEFLAQAWVQGVLFTATLAIGVKGYRESKQMLAKGQDIMANKVAAGGKLPVIYGNRRVGCQIVYMDTAGNNSTHLNVVYALSVGEVEEIMLHTLEVEGNPLNNGNQFRNGGYLGSDKISSGAGSLCTANQNVGSVDLTAGTFGTNPALGGYRYVFNAHHGAASQTADPMLVATTGGKWTSAHKLNGVAYIAASFIFDATGKTFSGVPRITVQVKGKKVYDQREDSTNGGSGSQRLATPSTYQWSDNPAIVFQDYILNKEYGKQIPSSQINFATFTTSANKADTLVDQPYFNGTAKALGWSGVSGDDYITVTGTEEEWWQNKVGELLYLFDSNGNGVLDAIEIKEARRSRFFGDSTTSYRLFIGATLTSNYPAQTGTSLVKVKRFHCNGYLDGNMTVMENSKELLANMRGIFLYVNGKYELQIEDTGSSTFSITDAHIIADAGISVDYGNKDKRANKVVIEYFNAGKKYELDTATVLHTASVPGEDYTYDDGGEELEIKAEFTYCTDPYIAYNMGKAILTRSRNQTTMQFLGTPEMYKLNVGDIVDLTYAGLGFNGKVCRVEALELQSDGLLGVSLIEYFDVYTWEVPPQEPVEALQNIPSAYAVKAPTSLAFTDTDDSNTGRPFLSWALPTDFPYYQWRINVKDSSNNQQINKIVDVNNCDLNFLPVDTNYVASVTALNTMGVESNPTTLTFTIGDAPTRTPDIQDSAIVTDKINNGAVTNVKVNDLSADKINTGELNLGTASGMAVRQGKTGYTSTTTGLWLGNDSGTPKLNIGSASKYLKFDGTNLYVAGDISASTGTISTSIAIGSGNNIFKADASGIYLGNATFASAPFRVAMDGSLTASSATITGTLTASNINASMFEYSGGNLIIKDDAITTAKIIDDAVTNALIATDAVNQDSIAANSVTALEIVAGTITATEIAATTITAAKIVSNTITAGQIATGTLTSASGVFGTISANDITTGTLNASNVTVSNLNADNITTGTLNANNLQIDDVTIDTDGSGNLIIKSGGVDTTQIANGAVETAKIGDAQITTAKIGDAQITNAKIDTLDATKITAGSIDSARINVDTLNVKYFANVSSKIYDHQTTAVAVPLLKYGSAIRGAGGTTTYTGSNASFVPFTITQIRNNASYTATLSAVLGNVNGGRVQYSLNNSTWVNASGGETNIYWNAGTYRGYTYTYQGDITNMTAAQTQVYWRVYFSGGYNHTYMQLHVTMDNTT